MAVSDLLFGTDIAELLSGQRNNPAYQQAQIQLGNLPRINEAAWNAFNQYNQGGTPQQQIAGFDPDREAGIQAQIAAAQGPGAAATARAMDTAATLQGGAAAGQQSLQNLAGGTGLGQGALQNIAGGTGLGQGALQNIAGGTGLGQGALQNLAGGTGLGQDVLQNLAGGGTAGQQALQNIAGGAGPQFGQQAAQDYLNFLQPGLAGAQQALANQANMAWNKGVGNLGAGGGGFASSGRNAQLAQAQENAATNLASQQQQLAFNAAQQAAQAGQQAGQTGYQGQLSAGQALTNQALSGAQALGNQALSGAQALGNQALSGAQALGNQQLSSGQALGNQQLSSGQALSNQALAGAQLTPTLNQALLQPGQVQEAGGAARQQQRQNELNAQYQNQLVSQQDPFKAVNYLSGALGTLGAGTQAANLPTPTNIDTVLKLLGTDTSSLIQKGAGAVGDLLGGVFDGLFGPGTSSGGEAENVAGGLQIPGLASPGFGGYSLADSPYYGLGS